VLAERLVGPVGVVVLDVLVEDSPEMATTLNHGPVEALVTHTPNEPFGEDVGFRGAHRGANHPDGFRFEDFVERSRELGVPIPDPQPEAGEVLAHREVPGLLADPRTVRMRGDPAEMHPAAGDLEAAGDIETAPSEGLDMEAVTRQHTARLVTQDAGPGRPITARCGPQNRLTQPAGHGARRDPHAEVASLPHDPPIPPAWVPPREAQHESASLRAQRWAAQLRECPVLADES
jgi:hypothetical protein